MKTLMFLADGFEDSEAIVTRDVLLRAGIEVITVSLNSNKDVISSFGLRVKADTILSSIDDIKDCQALILPGGSGGTKNMLKSEKLGQLLLAAAKEKILIAAICAAPMVLGKHGLLKGRKYTCFAGCQESLAGSFTGAEVEIDEGIITGRSMAYAIPFALSIIRTLTCERITERVLTSLKGEVAK